MCIDEYDWYFADVKGFIKHKKRIIKVFMKFDKIEMKLIMSVQQWAGC
jgi:hypothetical protein